MAVITTSTSTTTNHTASEQVSLDHFSYLIEEETNTTTNSTNTTNINNNITNNNNNQKTRRKTYHHHHNDNNQKTILAHGIDELGGATNAHFSHTQHMIAGAAAGMVEHSFMFPVDTIKTRMQSSAHTASDVKMSQVFKQIRSEGPFRLYSGLTAVLAGAIPSHALYFATYEFAKDCLHNGKVPVAPDPIITGVSAILATMVHDAISTPLDVVKQRMQLDASYRNMFSCFTDVTKREGIKAFFLSYPTTLIMNIPYALVHFIGYETFKYMLHDDDHDDLDHHDHSEEEEEKERIEHMWKHFVAGGGAGALGAAVSNPVDVMKTRLQTAGPLEYTGARDVLIRTLREEGLRGFMRGSVPRMLYHTPSAAITWTTYEYMKVFFKDSTTTSSTAK